MKKHIAEELPARQNPPAASSANQNKPTFGNDKGKGGGSKTPEQRIRQAVYDIRYRSRRENIPLRTAYSQYMQNSSMSEMEKAEVRNKLFGKDGRGGSGPGDQNQQNTGAVQTEGFKSFIKETAANSIANALYQVFVDNQPKITEEYIQELKDNFKKSSETSEDKKFKIRVTDNQSGVTYVRYATREKISQLRARGLEVEMTEYGVPYEGELKKGEQTSEVSRNRSRAKKDYDGDGKVESGAKEHAGAVHNAIQRKKGLPENGKDTSNVKESYIGEILGMANLPVIDEPKNLNIDPINQKIDVMPPDKKNKVLINPKNSLMAHTELNGNILYENGYSKFLNILQEKKMTAEKKAKEKKLKRKYDSSSMKSNMQNEYGENEGKRIYFAKIRKEAMKEESDCETKSQNRDEIEERGVETAMNRIKNKFRSMGAKRVIISPNMN